MNNSGDLVDTRDRAENVEHIIQSLGIANHKRCDDINQTIIG